ncbi:hypothetical protein GOP47_0005684 [Adiantum capillus-veneris]|uniref:Pentatricopeptide repeat-containing protein n=1 Tax=Adiantum capillus-veneris TaxID=13818 RepID=A0A9D4V5I9_ADICA|nr:hypothetical protein GOP47_0005684 [Adiantum capillus-veneris]
MHDRGDGSLSNQVVPLLAYAGKGTVTCRPLDTLVEQDHAKWNSIIIGHVNLNEPQKAIRLYHKVQKNLVMHLDKHAFVALLRACACVNDLDTGADIHAEVARMGLLRVDAFIACSLVMLYAGCGLLDVAASVFDAFPLKNAFLYNSLIGGYAECGHNDQVFDRFDEMKMKGVSPDAATYVCTLKACGNAKAVDKGQEIHAEIERQGLLRKNLIVGNSVVCMYTKCSFLETAQHVFYDLHTHDTVSWNTLISGYAEHGLGDEALKCFGQMQLEGNSPDAITCVCCLKVCGKMVAINKGQEIHAEVERLALLQANHYVGSTLVDMYGKCGLLAKAKEVFLRLPCQDVVAWNALLGCHAEYGNGEEVLTFLEDLHRVCISPDGLTFICCLKACGKLRAIDRGQDIHAEVEKRALLESDLLIGSSLVDMYAKCGCLAQAQHVFDRTSTRNLVSWNALIAGHTEHGHFDKALRIYEQMQLEGVFPDAATLVCTLKACGSIGATEQGRKLRVAIEGQGLLMRDILVGNALIDMYAKSGLLAAAQEVFDNLQVKDTVTWNALIAGYAVHNHGEKALDSFQKMRVAGVHANAVSFVCSLKACSSLGAFDSGRDLHIEIERLGLLEKDLVVGNNLVDMYARCGLLSLAKQVFDKLLGRDVVSWTALMAGYGRLGQSEKVFHSFDKMVGEGVKPNLVTFLVVLTACSRTSLFDRSQTYIEAMSIDHGLVPSLEHHTCIVDVFCRSGKLDAADMMLRKSVPFLDSVVWHALLDACRKWGNVEIAKRVFKNLVDSESNLKRDSIF